MATLPHWLLCCPTVPHRTTPYRTVPQGMGDVLLTYENEAFFTNLVVPPKERLPYIVPDNNIRVRGASGAPVCVCVWGGGGGVKG